jgi:2Fe-2S ferredoxin
MMAKITFIQPDGTEQTVQADNGVTVMQAATSNAVPGILAECGGALACATCHVYVEPEWEAIVGKPPQTEQSMLEFVMDPQPNSRLSCQINVNDAMDGLVLRVPKNQS